MTREPARVNAVLGPQDRTAVLRLEDRDRRGDG